MNVFIFYNGEEAIFPKDNAWEKFERTDTVRMFLACAESWRRAGWTPIRLHTQGVAPINWKLGGRVEKSWRWYPEPFWQFWAKAKILRETMLTFTTLDVINYGFSPHVATDGAWFEEPPPRLPFCVNYQRDHFSLSTFTCTPGWIAHAIEVLHAYDEERLPAIERDYVSDETILRTYAKHCVTHPLQAFPMPGADWQRNSLLHFARSTLAVAYEAIPTV